jgi:hypothetical protein
MIKGTVPKSTVPEAITCDFLTETIKTGFQSGPTPAHQTAGITAAEFLPFPDHGEISCRPGASCDF